MVTLALNIAAFLFLAWIAISIIDCIVSAGCWVKDHAREIFTKSNFGAVGSIACGLAYIGFIGSVGYALLH